MKDPIEIQLPGGNRILVIFCMDESGEQIPLTLLDDSSLDFFHSPAIESAVSESCIICIRGLTNLVNCSIASRTD